MNNHRLVGGVTTTPMAPNAIKGRVVDQVFDPASDNAQSGIAVAEAIEAVAGVANSKSTTHKGTLVTNAFNEEVFTNIVVGSIGPGMIWEPIDPFWLDLKIGDHYFNTEENKTYVCLNISVNETHTGADVTWRDLTFTSESSYVDLSKAASAIPNIISGGGKSILVNDVSPLAHYCSCRLTSDTYEETQSTGESNNIYEFNAENMIPEMFHVGGTSPVPYVINDNGTITFNGNTEPSGLLVGIQFHFYNLTQGQTYTFSLRNTQDEYLHSDVLTADDWSSSVWEDDMTANGGATLTITFTATDASGHHWCNVSCCGAKEWDSENTPIQRPIENLILYPQLEFGDTMTDWAPYGGGEGIVVTKHHVEDFSTVVVNVGNKSYTPSTDGIVTGIESVSPTMEITTDNGYVNIVDFTYCVDTKTYIDKAIANLKAELLGGS